MSHAYITNIASALPNAPVNNDEIETVLGLVDNRPSRARRIVLRNNGIKSRHYAIDPSTGKFTHSNAQLSAEAVRKLVSDQFTLNDIQCLAAGTSSPDQLLPNHGVMVHGELGNPSCEVMATSGICLAGMTAFKFAYLGVKAGEYEHAVACGSELSSLFMQAAHFQQESEQLVNALEQQPGLAFDRDFLRWMLSDGAGAVLLESQPYADSISLRIDWLHLFSYANEMETCMYAGATKKEDDSLQGWLTHPRDRLLPDAVMALKQDVKLLNENIVPYTVERPLRELIGRYKLRPEQFDYFLPHISSNYFRQPMVEGLTRVGLPIPEERWFTNLTTKGNTGAASIYIMLDELFHSGRLQTGQKLLCFVPESGRFSSSFMQLTVV